MNFYKHHIGDFDQATRHLSFIEDAAYCRMIRKYYAEEKVLPVDVKKIERLIGARTKEEREAVAVVLDEFFVLEDDGWHNKRCDEELAEAQESVSERDEKKANERERQKRHRAERKGLFEKLRALDIVPAYDTSTETLRALLSQRTNNPVTRDGSENVTREYESGNAHVTRTATANQTPDSRLQTPDLKAAAASTDVSGPPNARPAELSAAMRRNSIESQPGDPRVIAAAEAGVSVATVEAACAEAKASDPNGRIKPGFVLAIAERWTADAKKPRAQARASPLRSANHHDERAHTIAVLTGRSRDDNQPDEPFTIDAPATRIG
ncbi:DUF1376 domain-containing protein [Caballeronia udeis]|uniref:DUF1376 domain-containing protein n=1 Tax=Caballeronia udeis TaxID=1232866 RepID=UPI00384D6024